MTFRILATAILVIIVIRSPASAREGAPARITFAPYGWVPTLKGTASLGPVTVPVQVTPKDFAQGIKIGGMGYVRVDTEREFVYAEGIFMDYGNKSFRPFFGQSLTSTIWFGEIGAGLNRTIRIGSKTTLKVSPYIGVHHVSVESFTAGNLLTTAANGRWTNPVAGFTFELPLKKRWGVAGKIDGAGFGVTHANYGNATVMLDYRLGKRVTVDLGYRYASGRFGSASGLAFDLHGGGPIIGVRYSAPVAR